MNNIERIRTLSRLMQALCLAVSLLLPLLIAWIWLDFGRFAEFIARENGIPLRLDSIGPWTRLLAFACSLPPVAALVYGLLRLHGLFALYRRAKFFTAANIRHLRGFACALLAHALLTPVTGALLSVVLTMNNPPGQRTLRLSIGSGQLATAFIALLLVIITWIMLEGRKLADDSAAIV